MQKTSRNGGRGGGGKKDEGGGEWRKWKMWERKNLHTQEDREETSEQVLAQNTYGITFSFLWM